MRPLRFPFFILLTLTARVASASEDTDQFREDVFACEEAVGHLASCCPSFAPSGARCLYRRDQSGGCGYYTYHEEDPGIGVTEADCLLALDCGTIRERGICERALQIQSRRSTWTDEHGSHRPGSDQDRSEVLCR